MNVSKGLQEVYLQRILAFTVLQEPLTNRDQGADAKVGILACKNPENRLRISSQITVVHCTRMRKYNTVVGVEFSTGQLPKNEL